MLKVALVGLFLAAVHAGKWRCHPLLPPPPPEAPSCCSAMRCAALQLLHLV